MNNETYQQRIKRLLAMAWASQLAARSLTVCPSLIVITLTENSTDDLVKVAEEVATASGVNVRDERHNFMKSIPIYLTLTR